MKRSSRKNVVIYSKYKTAYGTGDAPKWGANILA